MLTKDDVHKIIAAMRNMFYDKEEMDQKFGEIRADFSVLQSSVDGIATMAKNIR